MDWLTNPIEWWINPFIDSEIMRVTKNLGAISRGDRGARRSRPGALQPDRARDIAKGAHF